MSVIVNHTIRNAAKSSGVCLWEVAEAYGISDGNFSRKLRKELPQQETEKILCIISRIAQRKTEAS